MALEDPRPSTTDHLVLGIDAHGVPVVLSLADLAGHGLICGVTGSGKTHTAKLMAEGLSALGVPTFAVDAKGDFAGIAKAGPVAGEDATAQPPPPVILWDLAGRRGHRLTFPVIADNLRQVRANGAAYVAILDATALIPAAATYAAAIFDLILDLAEPAVAARPAEGLQMVVLLEEAHLIFRHTDPAQHQALAEALAQLADRRIAVVFMTPAPSDLPDLLDQALDLRIQHSLWTPSEASEARLQAWFGAHQETGDLGLREAARSLEIGEALVALPGWPARRVRISKSATRDGPLSAGERRALVAATSGLLSTSTAVRNRARHQHAGLRSHGRRPHPRRTPR